MDFTSTKTPQVAKVFDVIPGPDESWVVLLDGQPLTVHQERRDAVKLAHEAAMQNAPSRLVIHAIDGFIESDTPYEKEACRGAICAADTDEQADTFARDPDAAE